VLLPHRNAHAFGLDQLNLPRERVQLKHLIGLLSQMSFAIEREAPPEYVQVVVVFHTGVRLSTLNLQRWLFNKFGLFPVYGVTEICPGQTDVTYGFDAVTSD